jgi:KDO2-lipid IV(A) lauroyltransferase
MNNMGYYLLYGIVRLVSAIPFWLMYRISDLLYFFNYYLIGYRRAVVFKNLRIAFPEKTPEEINRLARLFYKHFSDFLLEYVKCLSMSDVQVHKRFRYANIEVIRQLESEKKDIALVAAHYGNWELMTFFQRSANHRFMPIYKPLQNQAMDRLSRSIRGRDNANLVAMEHVFREAMKFRKEGRQFSVFFLADQRPPRTSRFWTTFLNHEVAFFEGMEKISRKLGMAVVFMDMQKTGRGKYEVHFTRLFDNAATVPENQVMLRCIQEMEAQIRRKPEFWLWSHNRFKHSRPDGVALITI